jgi:hypothetical protein
MASRIWDKIFLDERGPVIDSHVYHVVNIAQVYVQKCTQFLGEPDSSVSDRIGRLAFHQIEFRMPIHTQHGEQRDNH